MALEERQEDNKSAKDYANHAHIFKEKTAILDVYKCQNLAKFEREVKYVSLWF